MTPAIRKLGIGALGLLGGLLLGLVVQDLLATTVATNRLAVVASLLPLFGVAGAVVAILVDDRYPKR